MMCDHVAKNVFSIGSVMFQGFRRDQYRSFIGDVYFNLTREGRPRYSYGSFTKALEAMTPKTEEIVCDWPDMGAPPVGAEFYRAIFAEAERRAAELKRDYVIGVCCQMSHGRTGTTLAAFCIVCADMEVDKAIEFVRENHCKEAIETASQSDYLCELATSLGKKVDKDAIYNKYTKRAQSYTGNYGVGYHAQVYSGADVGYAGSANAAPLSKQAAIDKEFEEANAAALNMASSAAVVDTFSGVVENKKQRKRKEKEATRAWLKRFSNKD